MQSPILQIGEVAFAVTDIQDIFAHGLHLWSGFCDHTFLGFLLIAMPPLGLVVPVSMAMFVAPLPVTVLSCIAIAVTTAVVMVTITRTLVVPFAIFDVMAAAAVLLVLGSGSGFVGEGRRLRLGPEARKFWDGRFGSLVHGQPAALVQISEANIPEERTWRWGGGSCEVSERRRFGAPSGRQKKLRPGGRCAHFLKPRASPPLHCAPLPASRETLPGPQALSLPFAFHGRSAAARFPIPAADMTSALQQQLAQIAASSTHQLDLKAQKAAHGKSLLFDPKVAASQDFNTIYQICHEGFDELCALDPRFAAFAQNLFSEQSVPEDRTQMTKKENEELDLVLETFLGLVGTRLLLKPAVKAVEWLVRRFRCAYSTQDSRSCLN